MLVAHVHLHLHIAKAHVKALAQVQSTREFVRRDAPRRLFADADAASGRKHGYNQRQFGKRAVKP